MFLLTWLLNSLSHGLSIFQEGKSNGKDTMKLEARAELSKVHCTCVCIYTSITGGIQYWFNDSFFFSINHRKQERKGLLV